MTDFVVVDQHRRAACGLMLQEDVAALAQRVASSGSAARRRRAGSAVQSAPSLPSSCAAAACVHQRLAPARRSLAGRRNGCRAMRREWRERGRASGCRRSCVAPSISRSPASSMPGACAASASISGRGTAGLQRRVEQVEDAGHGSAPSGGDREAAVDVMDTAGQVSRLVRGEEGRHRADILDGDQLMGRCAVCGCLEQFVEMVDAARRRGSSAVRATGHGRGCPSRPSSAAA